MTAAFLVILLIQAKPVIRLDEALIEGDIRKPGIIEIHSTNVEKKIEEIALKNLVRLEEELLKPRKPEDID